jgi:hypothetical protein
LPIDNKPLFSFENNPLFSFKENAHQTKKKLLCSI